MDPMMSMCEEMLLILLLLRLQRCRKLHERTRVRRYWTHPLMAQRMSTGYFLISMFSSVITQRMFFNFTRMSIATFDVLLEKVRPRLVCMDSNKRRSVPPEEGLLVALNISVK